LNSILNREITGTLGLVYSDIGKNQQSLEYHNKALEIHKEPNDSENRQEPLQCEFSII